MSIESTHGRRERFSVGLLSCNRRYSLSDPLQSMALKDQFLPVIAIPDGAEDGFH
jgi:hypothetical protein